MFLAVCPVTTHQQSTTWDDRDRSTACSVPVRAYEYLPVPNYITVVGPLFSLLIHHAKIKWWLLLRASLRALLVAVILLLSSIHCIFCLNVPMHNTTHHFYM